VAVAHGGLRQSRRCSPAVSGRGSSRWRPCCCPTRCASPIRFLDEDIEVRCGTEMAASLIATMPEDLAARGVPRPLTARRSSRGPSQVEVSTTSVRSVRPGLPEAKKQPADPAARSLRAAFPPAKGGRGTSTCDNDTSTNQSTPSCSKAKPPAARPALAEPIPHCWPARLVRSATTRSVKSKLGLLP